MKLIACNHLAEQHCASLPEKCFRSYYSPADSLSICTTHPITTTRAISCHLHLFPLYYLACHLPLPIGSFFEMPPPHPQRRTRAGNLLSRHSCPLFLLPLAMTPDMA